MNNLPYGILIFDGLNNPIFCNNIITEMLPEKPNTLNVSSSGSFDWKENISKERVLYILENFIPDEDNVDYKFSSLRGILECWPCGNTLNIGKFQYCNKIESNYYVQGIVTIFQKIKCKVLIFQDQSKNENSYIDTKKSELYVASIAHDIRNPLNGIIGMLDQINNTQKQIGRASCRERVPSWCRSRWSQYA